MRLSKWAVLAALAVGFAGPVANAAVITSFANTVLASGPTSGSSGSSIPMNFTAASTALINGAATSPVTYSSINASLVGFTANGNGGGYNLMAAGNPLLNPPGGPNGSINATFSVTLNGFTHTFNVLNTSQPTDVAGLQYTEITGTGGAPFGSGSIDTTLEYQGKPALAPDTFGNAGQLFALNVTFGGPGFTFNTGAPGTYNYTAGAFNASFSGVVLPDRPTRIREIPEPATLATFGLMGVFGIVARRRMRKAVA